MNTQSSKKVRDVRSRLVKLARRLGLATTEDDRDADLRCWIKEKLSEIRQAA